MLTKVRTLIHEEISLLTVLYFPFRVRTHLWAFSGATRRSTQNKAKQSKPKTPRGKVLRSNCQSFGQLCPSFGPRTGKSYGDIGANPKLKGWQTHAHRRTHRCPLGRCNIEAYREIALRRYRDVITANQFFCRWVRRSATRRQIVATTLLHVGIRRKVNYPDPKGVPESILAKTGTMQVPRSPGAKGLGWSHPLYINSQCRPR